MFLDTGRCLTISGTGNAETDTEFRELSNGVWTNAAGTRVLVDKIDNGFSGCSAVNSVPNSNCIPSNRWAYIHKSKFENRHSPVNIWSEKGSSTSIYECGK